MFTSRKCREWRRRRRGDSGQCTGRTKEPVGISLCTVRPMSTTLRSGGSSWKLACKRGPRRRRRPSLRDKARRKPCGALWTESRGGGWQRPHKSRGHWDHGGGAIDCKISGSFLLNRIPVAMAKTMPIGAQAEVEQIVELMHTLAGHNCALPPVYSTPDMIRLMEIAAFKALQPYCEGDEITVGTSINIEHRAASGIGARVKAEAVLESFDGRFYTVRVTVRDHTREIGRGTVGRAVVGIGKFVERIKNEDQRPMKS